MNSVRMSIKDNLNTNYPERANDPLIVLLKSYVDLPPFLFTTSSLSEVEIVNGAAKVTFALRDRDIAVHFTEGELGNSLEFDQMGILEVAVTKSSNLFMIKNKNADSAFEDFLMELEELNCMAYCTICHEFIYYLFNLSKGSPTGNFREGSIREFSIIVEEYHYAVRLNFKLIQAWHTHVKHSNGE
jgi:hypothetical protein